MPTQGIQKITIPVKPNELTVNIVQRYIPYVFSQFMVNSSKIRADYNIYCLDHPILCKTRPYDDDSEVNNIVLVPNIKSVIDWKTGYIFGNPIKYAENKSNKENNDDIIFLNRYVKNSCKRSVDKEVGTWVYATGVGYYFIEPKSDDFDIETEAPFELFCRNADTCTKVYSSYNGNKPLFDLLYTNFEEIDEKGFTVTYNILDIYLPDELLTFKAKFGNDFELISTQPRGLFKKLPLIEKRANVDGIGIVALGGRMQDAIDKMLSNGLDNIDDCVNEIFVYKNVNLGKTAEEQKSKHNSMKKNGAVVLNSISKDTPAGLDTLSPKLSLSEVREFISVINALFHSAVGVPMEMSDTNSGGTTKQGSEVANGYDNAYNRALDDINTFIKADTELLDSIMWICKQTAQNKVANLATSEIEIMYSLNLTDNIQTKAQSYSLLAPYLPPDMILRVIRMSNDPESEGKAIEKFMREKALLELANKTETIDINEETRK